MDTKPQGLIRLEYLTNELQKRDLEISVLNKIYENAIEGVSYLNKNGLYEKVNLSYARNLGYLPEELIGGHWHKTVAPDCIAVAEEAYNKMLLSGKETIILKGIKKDNSFFWKRVTFIPNYNSSNELLGHYCFMQDITDQKQIELELKEAADKFEKVFSHAAIGMAITALDGKLLKVNPAYIKMLNYSEEELLALDFQSLTFPEDLPQDLINLNLLLSDKIKTYEMNKRYITKNKNILWIHLTVSLIRDENNNPKYFIAQVLDINRLMELEAQIKMAK